MSRMNVKPRTKKRSLSPTKEHSLLNALGTGMRIVTGLTPVEIHRIQQSHAYWQKKMKPMYDAIEASTHTTGGERRLLVKDLSCRIH